MGKEYKASDIQILEGLEAVRVRPGMYIGGTGNKGLHHILWEIVDNSIDELANGFGDTVNLIVYEDNSISVEDNGRGIPVDKHPKKGVSAVEVVFTELHAGGKFGSGSYNYSGGLHGVGASVTNALSEWLKVRVKRNNKVYQMEFASVEDAEGKITSGKAMGHLKETGEKADGTGTFVHFMPDARVFGKEKFIFETIQKRLRELAFLNKGLTLTVEDRREKDEEGNFRHAEFKYEGGLSDFVKYLNEAKETLYGEPFTAEENESEFQLNFAMQYTSEYTENMFSYVNNIPTTEGGTHETGFKSALTKVLNDLLRKKGMLKEKADNLLGEDFREGLTVVMSVKIKNPQFEGQTKTKLGNPEVKAKVEAVASELLQKFFENDLDPELTNKVLNKALEAAKVRELSRRQKEILRQKNSILGSSLVGKLAGCSGRKFEHNELFIVEGDSAGGSAKQGRDRTFQAILPLRGKPINAEKKNIAQLLANEEIRLIINALGAGFDDDFDISNLKYGKIIILADADQDGAHIRSILLTFFFRYMRSLITEGHVFIGMPPLYKVEKKDSIVYAYDDIELKNVLAKSKNYKIQRYKGLGEMNAEQLWETTLNPETRSLMRVNVDDAANADKMISTLMGDNIEVRRQYIYNYANFNKVDNFIKLGDRKNG